MDQILQIAAENIWTINIATPPPKLAVVSSGFRNVPEVSLAGWIYLTPANTGIETFYRENPDVLEAVQVRIRQEIATMAAQFLILPMVILPGQAQPGIVRIVFHLQSGSGS